MLLGGLAACPVEVGIVAVASEWKVAWPVLFVLFYIFELRSVRWYKRQAVHSIYSTLSRFSTHYTDTLCTPYLRCYSFCFVQESRHTTCSGHLHGKTLKQEVTNSLQQQSQQE